jgi:hypothetical protein
MNETLYLKTQDESGMVWYVLSVNRSKEPPVADNFGRIAWLKAQPRGQQLYEKIGESGKLLWNKFWSCRTLMVDVIICEPSSIEEMLTSDYRLSRMFGRSLALLPNHTKTKDGLLIPNVTKGAFELPGLNVE